MPDLTLDAVRNSFFEGGLDFTTTMAAYLLRASDHVKAAPIEALNDLVREAATPCKRDGCDQRAMPWSTFVARWGDHDLSCCSDDCRETVERQYEEYLREQSEERAAETRRDTALGG